MKPTFRSKVYRVAYELYHTTGKSWPICLTRAWAMYRLTRQMHRGVVNFAYERADGTLRKAKGTLMNVEDKIKGTGKTCYKTIRYYDVEAGAFRSFKVANFITVY
ncbi:MAG: SH3 beta-barrel fold-containing protein [Tannerellaceae bacterium]|nr:SH3 beta-barrel fold-containing protein [Tannerellaceae bacterium]MCD8177956.1 SH3 beta-barrel fold-containing protein [Tannerellaceae bacterium]